MPEDMIVNRVRSYTTGTPGRSLNQARSHHFVIDEPPHAGGPGEEVTPAEAFLAGVSACGVLLVEGYAHQSGIPLERAEAEIEGIRDRSDPSRFRSVRIRFRLWGPGAAEAQQLVLRYQEN